jgi:hypothetical protein
MLGDFEDNTEYFSRRAAEEDAAAATATHPLAREAHLEMAKRYRDAYSRSHNMGSAFRRMR